MTKREDNEKMILDTVADIFTGEYEIELDYSPVQSEVETTYKGNKEKWTAYKPGKRTIIIREK